jgi:hypothetical protein
VQIDHALRHQKVELIRAALRALGTRFGRVGLTARVETFRNCDYRRRRSGRNLTP